MFTLDWSNPQTFWLNVTNWILLLTTVAAVLVLLAAVAREIYLRVRSGELIGERDDHAAAFPELGLTMADGGEPVKPPRKTRK